jgi:hypothetical protein
MDAVDYYYIRARFHSAARQNCSLRTHTHTERCDRGINSELMLRLLAAASHRHIDGYTSLVHLFVRLPPTFSITKRQLRSKLKFYFLLFQDACKHLHSINKSKYFWQKFKRCVFSFNLILHKKSLQRLHSSSRTSILALLLPKSIVCKHKASAQRSSTQLRSNYFTRIFTRADIPCLPTLSQKDINQQTQLEFICLGEHSKKTGCFSFNIVPARRGII